MPQKAISISIKILIIIFMIVVGLAACFFLTVIDFATREQPCEIQNQAIIYDITPIGTYKDEVLLIIQERRGWELVHINTEFPTRNTNANMLRVRGAKSVHAVVDNLDRNYVANVLWGFDEDGKLIEVAIRFDSKYK